MAVPLSRALSLRRSARLRSRSAARSSSSAARRAARSVTARRGAGALQQGEEGVEEGRRRRGRTDLVDEPVHLALEVRRRALDLLLVPLLTVALAPYDTYDGLGRLARLLELLVVELAGGELAAERGPGRGEEARVGSRDERLLDNGRREAVEVGVELVEAVWGGEGRQADPSAATGAGRRGTHAIFL